MPKANWGDLVHLVNLLIIFDAPLFIGGNFHLPGRNCPFDS